MIQGQATVLAYTDVIGVLLLVVACLIPLVFIMRRPPKRPATEQIAMH